MVTYLLYTLLFSSGFNLPCFEGKGFLSLPLPSSGIICLPVTAWVSTTGNGQLPAVYKVEKSSPHGMTHHSHSTNMGRRCTQMWWQKIKHMTTIKNTTKTLLPNKCQRCSFIIYLSKNKKLTQHTAIILVILNNDIIIINSIVRNDIFFISS